MTEDQEKAIIQTISATGNETLAKAFARSRGYRVRGETPDWPGSDVVYSRLYRLLEKMGADNWKSAVEQAKKRRRKVKPPAPTEDMKTIIKALDKGDEEELKGLMHQFRAYGSVATAAKTKKNALNHIRESVFALKKMAHIDRQYTPALKAAEALMKMVSKLPE